MGLRPYQTTALDRVREDFNNGIEKLLVIMATGLGKTEVMARIPPMFPRKRSMFLVHTDELCGQMSSKMQLSNPGLRVGVEMGSRSADGNDDIIVASPQTLGRAGSNRLNKFDPADFGALAIDECHHSLADIYGVVTDHFGFGGEDKTGRLLYGTTATPGRGDGQGLARRFDKISYTYGLLEGIRDGWLCGLRGARVRTNVNLDGVSTRDRELNQEELSLAVNIPSRNRLIIEEWLKHGERRKTIAFTVDIAHAKALAETFMAAGVKAAAVWGDDPDRKEKLAAHRRGDLEVLCNSQVLTEGYDDPTVQCVLLAAPTKSQLRYIQRIGRGTRLPAGIDNLHEAIRAGIVLPKVDCLVLDFTDASTRHSLVSLPSIFGLPPKLDMGGRTVMEIFDQFEEAKQRRPETDFSELEDIDQIHSYIERVDLFEVKFAPEVEANSKMQWHRTAAGDYILLLPKQEKVTLTQDLLGQWRIHGVVQGSEFEDTARDLPEAFGTADNMIRYLGRNLLKYVRRDTTNKALKEPATPAQLNAIKYKLRVMRRDIPDLSDLTKHEASKLLRKLDAA